MSVDDLIQILQRMPKGLEIEVVRRNDSTGDIDCVILWRHPRMGILDTIRIYSKDKL